MTRYIDHDKMIGGLRSFLGPIDLGIIRELTIRPSDMEVSLEVFVKQSDGTPLRDAHDELVTTWVTYPYGSKNIVEPALNTEDE